MSVDRKIGLILIGDELLSGLRQDKHMAHIIAMLKQRGLKLDWVEILSDGKADLIQRFQRHLSQGDIVFSCGGIGATPDDLTREAAALAAGQTLTRHAEAEQLIVDFFADRAHPKRVIMADLASNASLIPNPVNQIPGFSIDSIHFVPGFPDMAWPMIEWVLDTHYTDLFNQQPHIQQRWLIHGQSESDLIDFMEQLLTQFPHVQLSSLPRTELRGKLIDFGISANASEFKPCCEWIESQWRAEKIDFEPHYDAAN